MNRTQIVTATLLWFIALTYLPPPAIGQASSQIRQVDFKNFTYQIDGQVVRVRNGKRPARNVNEYSVNEVLATYGDLTGDQQEEAAVVLIYDGGGSGSYTSGFLYTMQNNRPVLLATFEGGDRADGGIVSATIQQNHLFVARNVPEKENGVAVGLCCPKSVETKKYRWDGSRLVLAVETPRGTPGAVTSGRLLFSSNRDGNQEVYSLDPATRKETNLTNNPADDGYPRMSPDGRRIAFASNRDGYWTIYLMKPDGTQLVRLLKERSESGYADWSPDSRSLVFAASRVGDRKNEIYVIGADGSLLRKLTNHPAEDVHPAWSPDGRKIAFVSERDGNRRIYLMNADGGNLVCLTDDRWYSDYPAWSPDSSRIAFASDRDSKASSRLEIYVMSATGTNVQRITNNTADDRHPCWSADGKTLAFTSDRLGDRDIFTANADGSAPKVLARATGNDEHPQWIPAAAKAAGEVVGKAADNPPKKEGFRQRMGTAIKEGVKDGLGITEIELRKKLFEQLVADGEVSKQSCAETGENDPAKIMETEKVDLNGDGVPEIKVFGHGCACQGARRCMQWLYRKSGTRYELLASIPAADEIQLLRSSTNGYCDLNVLYPPGINDPGWNVVFKFDGRRYQEPKQQQQGTTGNVSPKPEQGDWATFWPAFRSAVQRRDRAALKSMMTSSFEWAGDGQVSSTEAIRNLDQGIVSWQSLLNSVNNGVTDCKSKDSSCWNFNGRRAKRTIKSNWLVFELGADGRWKWVRLVGD